MNWFFHSFYSVLSTIMSLEMSVVAATYFPMLTTETSVWDPDQWPVKPPPLNTVIESTFIYDNGGKQPLQILSNLRLFFQFFTNFTRNVKWYHKRLVDSKQWFALHLNWSFPNHASSINLIIVQQFKYICITMLSLAPVSHSVLDNAGHNESESIPNKVTMDNSQLNTENSSESLWRASKYVHASIIIPHLPSINDPVVSPSVPHSNNINIISLHKQMKNKSTISPDCPLIEARLEQLRLICSRTVIR